MGGRGGRVSSSEPESLESEKEALERERVGVVDSEMSGALLRPLMALPGWLATFRAGAGSAPEQERPLGGIIS
jgi:hypothetical protein